jgi:hypothetical protein
LSQSKPTPPALFFITGPMRSGTTLLDKIMHSHQSAVCLSQPAMALYISVKKAFLATADIEERYEILSSYFLENRYKPEEFTTFLETFHFTEEQIGEINEAVKIFLEKSPHYSKSASIKLEGDNDLLSVYRQIVTNAQPEKSALAFGSKEIIAEEFLPYLLKKGVKCLLILRDPRDALTSAYYGKGSKYVGTYKPSLLMIRNWRKAVAFALELEGEPNLLVLRYEDLVSDPATYLRKITEHVGIPEIDLKESLASQNGGDWGGNSSHEDVVGISTKSIGRYKDMMQTEVQHYIESVCYPEMAALGYENPLSAPDEALIRSFVMPEPIASMDKKMTDDERMIEAGKELTRLVMLSKPFDKDPPMLAMQQSYFIFPGVYEKLKKAVRVLV